MERHLGGLSAAAGRFRYPRDLPLEQGDCEAYLSGPHLDEYEPSFRVSGGRRACLAGLTRTWDRPLVQGSVSVAPAVVFLFEIPSGHLVSVLCCTKGIVP